jgi:hypothetical protein
VPRIRTIKPELASDEKLASVSREARLTFVLLMTQADDDGLLPGRARQLLGALYPHDEDIGASELHGWLSELAGIGVVRMRETLDGAPIVEITNWSKHQRVDHKAKSLILNNLKPLATSSRESHEDNGEESRESRAPTLDLRPTTNDQRPASEDRRARVREALPESARAAFDGLLRASRNAEGVVAVVASLNAPISGGHPPYPWEVIGAALVDYAGKSPSEFSAKLLRAICADFAERPAGPAGEHDRERARREAIEAARRFQQRGEPAEVA